MITLTDAAATRICKVAAADGSADMPLRVAARRDADGSIRYGMGLDDLREHDHPLLHEGVTVPVDRSSRVLLDGSTPDLVELDPGRFSFIFVAPDHPCVAPPAASGCGNAAGGECAAPSGTMRV